MFVSAGSALPVPLSVCDESEVVADPPVTVKAVQTSAVSSPLSKVLVATEYMPTEAGAGDQTFLVPLIFWNFRPREISEVHFW